MRSIPHIGRLGFTLCLAAAASVAGRGQERPPAQAIVNDCWLPSTPCGGPLTGGVVADAPFSADATTTVWQTRADGTVIERAAKAHYYRDGAGRVRVEETAAAEPLNYSAAEREVIHIKVALDPANSGVYIFRPTMGRVTLSVRGGVSSGGGDWFVLPTAVNEFKPFARFDLYPRRGSENTTVQTEIGSRRIADVETIGRRITMAVPANRSGTGQPDSIVEERWESPELKLLIFSRYSDPRKHSSGPDTVNTVIEYRLTNIRRTEPSPELFVLPEGYTLTNRIVDESSVTCRVSRTRQIGDTGDVTGGQRSREIPVTDVCACLPQRLAVPACSTSN